MFDLFSVLSVLPGAGLAAGARPSPPTEDDVLTWVRLAQGGDAQAARDLYRHHAERVFRAVRPMCDSEAEAEDIVQETFGRAFEALDRFEPRARFISWLLRIAINRGRTRARRRRRQVPTAPEALTQLTDAEPRSADPLGEGLDRLRLRQALLTALSELDERARDALTLRYAAELTVSEVSELLGMEEANLRKLCERRRATLLRRLDELMRPQASVEESADA